MTAQGTDSPEHCLTHTPSRPSSAGAGAGVLTVLFSVFQPVSHETLEADVEDEGPAQAADSSNPGDGLPQYRLSEIKNHGPKSSRPWVIFEDKVYDITDWIPAHPGGEVILRAAGGSIEPYWDIFAIHKTPYVREILQQFVVGKIHPDDLEDGRPRMNDIEDPFVSDPTRDPRLRQITAKPCNAETAGEDLAEAFLTPNEVFYVRNHMWVPVIEDTAADAHGITIELPDGDVKTYTVHDLKAKFKQYSVTAVLQCSGNRRRDMTEHANKTNGLQWGPGAISCAKWEGVRLRDVLKDAGLPLDDLPEDAQHVQFSGLEAYGASIPIHSALDPRGDVLLAFKMNDLPLPRDHGFPVRVIVPGTVAARCVKWVSKIVVSDEESDTSWQRRDYKCFGPNETRDLDWDKYKSIQEMPITSAITRARKKSADGNHVEVEGYAYSGGGHEIQRVDVSLDGGKTWDQASLVDDSEQDSGSKAWSWKRWRYEGALPTTTEAAAFVVKATDDAYNTQPQCYKSIYNLRGNLATAWHRVEFDPRKEKGCADS
ncbi:sulfite oxidase-like protein [Pseudomassariella vexata]|uniref:Nitrate reductase [NADPH] n=1 Tax=Pseudomassariella vexata TaxID=1141098 RepID=A0A1Y2EFK8_9PEZI|nr:sulfite oxidase-like protein [Pseudomassariella vexata]ORY70363.1 sulfite oxidase-like protein [Pseudomassariella vexata]